jgi:hypothetical protein
MNKPKNLEEHYNSLNDTGKRMYDQLNALINQSQSNVIETLFVSNPYFYLKQYEHMKPHFRPSIVLVFYKDHVNIFALGVKALRKELNMYKISDKDTLQIYYDQLLLNDVCISLFKNSLEPLDSTSSI